MKLTFFTIMKFIHVAFVVFGMGTALFLHTQFLRKSATWGTMKDFFHLGSRNIWIGLAGSIITGIIMWIKIGSSRPELFYGKVGLVAMLLINGVLIHFIGKPRLNTLQPDQNFHDLPPKDKRILLFSGVMSTLGWWGALLIAYLV